MRGKFVLAAVAAFSAGVWLNNSSLIHTAEGGRMTLLAHRGVHQTYKRDGLKADTCTAQRINEPTHGLLENTLPSMEAAFAAGADIVEFDIHPTTDGRFAVLHDWTVDCRANGKGVTREHSMAELKQLDIGYGYTADGGKTFPFRGKGVGMMLTLDEVLARFPDKRFLINVKSNDPNEGDLLAARLVQLTPEHRSRLMVYGGDAPIGSLHAKLPDIVTMGKGGFKSCALRYMLLGWSGYVPEGCRNTVVLLPVNVAPWVWGYPHRLAQRMKTAGTSLFIVGQYEGGEFSSGVDDAATFARLPGTYSGGVWTNRIEAIGKLVR